MEITHEEIPWDSDDVAIFRAFLTGRTGQRFLPKLAESLPRLLPKGETNAICIRSGEVLGFQRAMTSLLALTVIAPPVAQGQAEKNYPELEDDSAWPITEDKTNT